MRQYPHEVNQKGVATAGLVTRQSFEKKVPKLSQFVKDRQPAMPSGLTRDLLRLVAFDYANGVAVSELQRMLGQAAEYAQLAVEFGAPLSPTSFMTYLGLAHITAFEPLRRTLEPLSRGQYTNPSVTSDESFYLLAEVLAFVSAGDTPSALSRVRFLQERLANRQVPTVAEARVRSLVPFAEAVSGHNEAALAKAADARMQYLVKTYNTAEFRNSPDALLDLEGLGWLALAKTTGLHVTTNNVYLPSELLV